MCSLGLAFCWVGVIRILTFLEVLGGLRKCSLIGSDFCVWVCGFRMRWGYGLHLSWVGVWVLVLGFVGFVGASAGYL